MKERKPKYLRHFLKKLVPCLITAVLVGAACSAGLYGIRYQSVRSNTRKMYNDLLTVFHDCDITKLTDNYMTYLMDGSIADDGDAYDGNKTAVDRAFRLERTDTGDVWFSEPILWAVNKHQHEADFYFSYDEAMLSVYDKLPSLRRKYSTSKGKYDLRVQLFDCYVRENDDVFLPGNVNIIRYSLYEGDESIVESYDLTPSDTSGYTHLTGNDSLALFSFGAARDSQALELLQTQGENALDRGMLFPPPGEPLEVKSGTHELFINDEGAGIPCYLSCAVYYHFWTEQKGLLLHGYSILLLLACITAAITAGFSFSRSRKVWEMAEYRRNLTNTLAHDLKSPLTAIACYAENQRTGMHKDKQNYYTEAILQNTQYMDKIIADVLELSSLESTRSVRKEQTDVTELFREAFAQYEPELAERHIALHINGSCIIRADRRMMMQAAANLASNAVRYTPDGETITVTGSAEKLTISNDCNDISDAGKLAEPFAKNDTARNDHSRSGLGLTIVRQIMELHRFRLSLDVKDEQFVVELHFSTK